MTVTSLARGSGRRAAPLLALVMLASPALSACTVRVRPPAPARLPSAAIDASAAVVLPSTLDFELTTASGELRDLLVGAANRGLVDTEVGAAMSPDARRAVAASWPAPSPPGEPEERDHTGAQRADDVARPEGDGDPPPDIASPTRREDPDRAGVHPALPRSDRATADPQWRTVDGLGVRAALYPTGVTLGADAERWVITLSFDAAIQASRDPDGAGSKTACGCDGGDWCGGRARPMLAGIATWSFVPTIGPGWRVVASPVSTVTVDGSCAVAIPRAPARDAARAFEALYGADFARVGQGIADSLAQWAWVRDASERLWTALETSRTDVVDDGPHLHLRPRGLAPVGLYLRNGEVRYAVQARLRPYTTMGRAPEPMPMPDPRDPTAPPGFRVVGSVAISSQELAAPLRARLVGRRIPDRPSNQVTVTDVEVYGTAERLAIRIAFVGAATGDAYFVGSLELDEDAAEVRLRDVRPTPETAAALAKLYDETETWSLQIATVPWFDTAQLSAEITEVARWSFAPATTSLIERITSGLDRRRVGDFIIAFEPRSDTTVLMLHDGNAVQVQRAVEGEARARTGG
jgi:hypothetical protein